MCFYSLLSVIPPPVNLPPPQVSVSFSSHQSPYTLSSLFFSFYFVIWGCENMAAKKLWVTEVTWCLLWLLLLRVCSCTFSFLVRDNKYVLFMQQQTWNVWMQMAGWQSAHTCAQGNCDKHTQYLFHYQVSLMR